MATSTLYQSSPLGGSAGSPRSCLYLPRQQTFQPKADWRASFIDTNPTLPSTKPLILRQHNGVWLPRYSDTSKSSNPQPQAEPRTPSTPPKTAKESVISPTRSRLSLGRATKTLRCHVCLATVKEQLFHNHLFFGVVRCDLCDSVCGDCRSFERLNEEVEFGYTSCHHCFTFAEDPYQYLLPRMSGSDDFDVGGSLTLPHNLRVLQHYINKLTTLHLREPWSTAVRRCKSQLLKAQIAIQQKPSEDLGLRNDPLPTDVDSPGGGDLIYGNTALSGEREEQSGSVGAMPTCLSPARLVSQKALDSDDGVLLTQSYSLEHLEQSVEYVELEEQCRAATAHNMEDQSCSSKSKKRRKISHYRKLKAHRLTPQHRKKTPMLPASAEENDDDDDDDDDDDEEEKEEEEEEDKSALVKEQVELPEDGYYLMVKGAVEECPMCYEPLCPSLCTVNVRNFLFTVRCPECDLMIFMVPDLPDGLQIVMEDAHGGVVAAHTKQVKSNNKSKKVNPREFFAS